VRDYGCSFTRVLDSKKLWMRLVSMASREAHVSLRAHQQHVNRTLWTAIAFI
jgi:hypothetical protein